MKKFLLFLLITSGILSSNDTLEIGDDFLATLDEASEIATKTKLNIDDTPSFVTVLHSSKLKKLGIVNVFQALGLVPGVQLKREASGVPVVVFRGLDEKGEVKLMVDGVVINNNYRGSSYYYLDFPLEMIDRIEVIRGAGSTLYGSNAMSGVINIITNGSQKDNANSAFVGAGSYGKLQGGALVSTKIKDIKFALDAYYQKSEKTIFIEPNTSLLTGDSDRHLEDYSVGLNISDEYFEFLGRIKESDIGNAYGILGVLDTQREKYNNKNRSLFTQFSYKNNFDRNNKLSFQVGYNNYKQLAKAEHGIIRSIDADYEESSYFTQLDFTSNYFSNNKLLIGARYESADTDKSSWSIASGAIAPISNPNFSRKITALYFEDTYNATKDFDISAGLRYDNYSDIGDNYSPNLGLVYRLTKEIKLKARYSDAFRAPSWVELTSNPNLKPEKSYGFEAGTIFEPNSQNLLRVNFYLYEVKDMIKKDLITRKYVQNAQNEFYGAELEYIYSPTNQLEVDFLASYVKAKDNKARHKDLAGIANVLASTFLTYETDSGFIFGSLLKYVSKSSREETDTRPDMDDSFVFDQTISYIYKDFTASLILKDLFDTHTYYALPKNSYMQDFDDGGRNLLLKLSLEF